MNSSTSNFSLLTLLRARGIYVFIGLLLLGGVGKNSIEAARKEPQELRRIPRSFWLQKTFAAADYDFVIAGDSRAYSGLSPAVMAKELTGARGLNLGYPLIEWTDEYCRLIESKLAPTGMRIVVLGVSPHSLITSAQPNRSLRQYLEAPRMEVLLATKTPHLVEWFQPLKLTDVGFLALQMGPFAVLRSDLPQRPERQMPHQDGWVECWGTSASFQGCINWYQREFTQRKISNERLCFLVEYIARWSNGGIRVFCIRLPASEEIEDIENSISGFEERIVASAVANAGGKWIWLKDRQSCHTYDGSHLSRESAIRVSEYVAAEVASTLDGEG